MNVVMCTVLPDSNDSIVGMTRISAPSVSENVPCTLSGGGVCVCPAPGGSIM